MWHILKCPDYHQSKHLFSVCPYDALHVFRSKEDLEVHIQDAHQEEIRKIAEVADYYKPKQEEESPWDSEWPQDSK